MSDGSPPAHRGRIRWLRHLGRAGSFALGVAGPTIGVVLGLRATERSVDAANDDLAGMVIIIFVPVGYLIGLLVAWSISMLLHMLRETRQKQWSPPVWTFLGGVSPVLLLVAVTVINGLVHDARLSRGDRTEVTAAAADLVTEQIGDLIWSAVDDRDASLNGCNEQVSSTSRHAEVGPDEIGPALLATAAKLEEAGFETTRGTVRSVPVGHRWSLVARRPGRLVRVVGSRHHLGGQMTVTAFAGPCLDGGGPPDIGSWEEAQRVAESEELRPGWDESLLLAYPAEEAQRLRDALDLVVSPNGEVFRPVAPAWVSNWSACPEESASMTTFFAGYRFSGTQLFDWYIEREHALAAGGWTVRRARFVTPGVDEPDTEQWLMWATKDDVALAYRMEFTDRPQVGQFNSYWQDIYLGPCVAARGQSLIEHHEWYDADLLRPELAEPPDIYN